MAAKILMGMTAVQIIKAAPTWATHVSAGGVDGNSFLLYENESHFQAYFDGDYGLKITQATDDTIIDVALPLNTLTQLKEHFNE